MTIVVRDYRDSDLERIMEIEEHSFFEPYDRGTFLHLSRSSSFLVAEIEDRVEGYIIYASNGGRGIIVSLAVSSETRRRGIGGLLLNKTIDDLKRMSRIELQVSAEDEHAIVFYRKRGFTIKKLLENYYGAGKDGYLMSLEPVHWAPLSHPA